MKQPKTVRGFLALIKPISNTSIAGLKDFDKLTKEQQTDLYDLQGDCENIVGEYEDRK